MRVHIRWMIRCDMPEVQKIENESFEFPWSDDDFIRCLRQSNCVGMVAEYDEQVVGFFIYELYSSLLDVLNFAVKPCVWRNRIGTAMVDKLKSKLTPKQRNNISTKVRETNLDGQLFFAAQGFIAVDVLREYYNVTDEDAYVMRFDYPMSGGEVLDRIFAEQTP